MFLDRKLIDVIEKKIESPKIITLLGARQTGKTSIFNDFPGAKEIIVNHSNRQEEKFGDTMVLSSCNFFHHLDEEEAR